MTRKRFIKLMMAKGYSRNCAAVLAMSVSRYGSYTALYHRFVDRSIPSFDPEDIRRRLAMAFSDLFESWSDALARMDESMRRVSL